ncbi:MAG: DUF86 domain-containing protein [Prevotellaceae bacterium]|jgi:uncharacterized protein with HEPN domain|nr:DUF86 domain-containing protein [Prevotellaceae bacterium]
MYDKTLVADKLQRIEISLTDILEWTSRVNSVDDFLMSNEGMILLNAVCMKLFAVGEEVKTLDKHTAKTFLPQYPQIQWKYVMGMRDIIAHHYFELDADKVFDTLKEELPELLKVIIKMKNDLQLKIYAQQ